MHKAQRITAVPQGLLNCVDEVLDAHPEPVRTGMDEAGHYVPALRRDQPSFGAILRHQRVHFGRVISCRDSRKGYLREAPISLGVHANEVVQDGDAAEDHDDRGIGRKQRLARVQDVHCLPDGAARAQIVGLLNNETGDPKHAQPVA